MSFSFNGKTRSYVRALRGVERPAWAPIEHEIIDIPGRPGGLKTDKKIKARLINVPVEVKGVDSLNLQRAKEDLAEWLYTDEPAELIFNDEQDRVYYAEVTGELNLDEILQRGKGIISFICTNPFKYEVYDSAGSFSNSTAAINVKGSAEIKPVVRIEVSKDTTFLALSNGEKLNVVGDPLQVGQQPFVREERKLWDELGNLVGWADTTVVEEGVIRGTMKTNGYSFYTNDYGSDPGWHGPAKRRSLSEPLQDFQIDVLLRQLGSSGQVGSIEIAFLDASNKFVGKMLITKRSAGSLANWVRMRAGTSVNGKDFMNTRGTYENTWANFNGILRISRVGDLWTAYAGLIDSKGVQHTRAGGTFRDTTGISTAPITQIQLQLWQNGTVPATNQNIDDLKVFKINKEGSNQVPFVALKDDIIEFDGPNNRILRNGENISKYKPFIAEFFPLKKGLNVLTLEPADAVKSASVRWKEAYL